MLGLQTQRKKEVKACSCTAWYPAVSVSYPGLLVSEKREDGGDAGGNIYLYLRSKAKGSGSDSSQGT